MPINTQPADSTPLQRVLGFTASEEAYDLLDLREQLIIDLKIAGWSTYDIAFCLGLSQGWVSILFRRARYKLANSVLIERIEIRQYYKETSPIIAGEDQTRLMRSNIRRYED